MIALKPANKAGFSHVVLILFTCPLDVTISRRVSEAVQGGQSDGARRACPNQKVRLAYASLTSCLR